MSVITKCIVALITAVSLIACEKADPEPKTTPTADTPYMNVCLSYVGGKLVNVRTGTERLTYYLESGESGVIDFSITNVSGNIDIKVYRSDDSENPFYEEYNIPSSNFSVDLHGEGEYIVWITAKSFAGKYEISWKPQTINL